MDALPPLRQELNLAQSPANSDGSPVWTLYDPAAHRFYQLAWPAFEILSRWPLGNAAAVVAAVRRDTTLRIELDEVLELVQFLTAYQLIEVSGARDTQRLLDVRARQRLSPAMWALKHYLFIRVPLLEPMGLLRKASPLVQWVFRPMFWWTTLISAGAGLYLASRHWEQFLHTFRAYAGWEGLLGIAVALSIAKVLHEFGHAITAYRYGCHVPTMGVALLVLWPVLYTDANEAWKLRSRRERLHIGAAGMLAELALAAYATLLWNFIPDGPLRAGVFMLATSTWVITLGLNASPFTRFDGYFLLSDWLRMPNLHDRAFALTRWWLRERLFGFGDVPAETFATARRRFLIAFSLTAWLYRLVLFFSIALLVFHFFFHVLGLILMLVEVGWFILRPMAREMLVWWQRRGDSRWNRQCSRTAAAVVVVLFIVLAPMSHSISAPALLVRARAQGVYAAHPAVIQTIALHEGQAVAQGAILARLSSPELEYQLGLATAEEASLRWQVEQQPFNDELRKAGPALRKQWRTARETLGGLRAEAELLTLRAPFAGQIADLDPELRSGVWLRGDERLFGVIGNKDVRGEAFVEESALPRIHEGATADFVADLPEQATHHCMVSGIDRINIATLEPAYNASIYGGSISSRKDSTGAILPLAATFRVRFENCGSENGIAQETPGRVLLHGAAESFAAQVARWLIAIGRREITT
jgi:putative peptide zinc metalloprotease protein